MIDSIRSQFRVVIEKRWAVGVILLMFTLVLINFFSNVFKYQGTDVQAMINPMRLLFLSSESMDPGTLSFYFLQLFPLLVILPVGFSYADDKNSREEIYLVSRVGKKKYFWGKTIAVFIVNFCVFALPLMLEIILNCVAFPLDANGNFANSATYDLSYIMSTENYMFFDFFKISPILYAFISCMMFGIVAGILGIFTLAVSMFFFRFKIGLLFPVYILLYGIGMIDSLFPQIEVRTSHFAYLSAFDISYKSEFSYICLFGTIAIISMLLIYVKQRRDVL